MYGKNANVHLVKKKPLRFFEALNDAGALALLFPDLKLNRMPAELNSLDPVINFALVMSQLNEEKIKTLCTHYRLPKQYVQLAEQTARWKRFYETQEKASAEDFLKFIKGADALRRPDRFQQLLNVLKTLYPMPDIKRINNMLNALQNIKLDALQDNNLKGNDFANALYELQLKAIQGT